MTLIPALGMKRQEGTWLGGERNIRKEEIGAQHIQFEDF